MASGFSSSNDSKTKKRALLIGNNKYKKRPQLRYCINNVEDIAEKLHQIDFEVTIVTDQTSEEMDRMIEQFKETISPGDLILFFFAGYGCHRYTPNYLIPVNDDRLKDDIDLKHRAIDVQITLEKVISRRPSAAIFLLDCCSTNVEQKASNSSGLALIRAAADSLIAFACDADKTISDGSANRRNSVFTAHLLRHIAQPNVTIEEIMHDVCEGVMRDTNDNQCPFQVSSLRRKVYLNYQVQSDHSTSSDILECPICARKVPRCRMENMFLCDHTCCLECVKAYYRATVREINDPESLKKLTCCVEPHPLPDDVKLNFFGYLGTKFNQWFANERRILDVYHENLYIATQDSHDKKCGNPECSSFFFVDNLNEIARAQCPHCNFQQCQQCSRKWNPEHNEMTCDEYADWLKGDDPEMKLTKYLSTAGIICPNERCKAIYEFRQSGCEHFTCPMCKTEFCRICSSLIYNPKHNIICPRANCPMKQCIHVHCYLNCYREIRDAEPEEIIRLLTAHKINVQEELRQEPKATDNKCPVADCGRAPSSACDNRFCDSCYKEFLCLFVWRNQIEPWELYTDNNLRQKLVDASVIVPENADRATLIALARQHLTQFLGKPKPIPRTRRS